MSRAIGRAAIFVGMGWRDDLRRFDTPAGRREREQAAERARRPGDEVVDIGGSKTLPVVGESYYQDALDSLTGGGVGVHATTATLTREPNNPHDLNAIRVDCGGRKVGYVSAKQARQLAAGLDRLGGIATCPATIARRYTRLKWHVVLQVDRSKLSGTGARAR